MGVKQAGPRISHSERLEMQLLLPKAVDEVAQARVHILVHNDVAQVVADGHT